MTCLAERLQAAPADALVWLTTSGERITAGALRGALARVDAEAWRGKRVALGDMPVLEFLLALLALDGLAQALVLLPAEEGEAARAERLRLAPVDVVLDAQGLGLVSTGDAPWQPHADVTTEWLLPTSGTTGTPKLIAHTQASLTRTVRRRAQQEPLVWASLYSLRRFAGLQVFLQSWWEGSPLILTEDDMDLGSRLEALAQLGCSALSATPSMWRKLAMLPPSDGLTLRQITLGGEIVDQAVLDLLARRFPTARITHIYASTEAGVGFAVRDGQAGFPASYLNPGALDIELRVGDDQHLWLRPPRSPDWVDSGDIVRPQGDRLYFLGRANGSINVGGNKVMPEEVEAVILELPEIAFVQVRARASAVLGSLVEAAVLPAEGAVLDADLKKRVMAHCRGRIEAFKVPAFVVLAQGIAVNAAGKMSRTA
ncbi:class I adenylate-forming enzyme family protein [Roseateles sp. NT4]|uniref:class I adenylate-forming enzyme family protein n=1 Tax=Roseateles sp. NT4 TaxID=3453715 RepID=UPI003EEB06A4